MKYSPLSFHAFVVLACAGTATSIHAQLASFPGALGYGATATGARGGSVYHVTNLNDSGAGSFRDAVSASGRTIVFDVGGYINLASAVSAKSNLTIAGQTAPGGGIGFTGAEISFANQTNIICRFVRMRPGGSSASSDDCLSLYRANTAIMDHCSFDFAKWNNIDAVGDSTRASTNFTFQNCIIADAIGQQFGAHMEMVGGFVSWFNNIFANGHNRQPLCKDNTVFINNTLYNFSAGYTTHTSTRFKHDIINNYFICGPASGSGGNAWFQIDTNQSMYYTGNLLDNDKDSTLNGSATAPYPGYQGTGTVLTSPWSPITTAILASSNPPLSPANAVIYNNSNAGGLPHDEIESLVISQVKTLGNGPTGYGVGSAGPNSGLYTSQTQTGLSNNGFGTIANGTAPIDSDQDGMPDDWETAKGLSPSNASDGATVTSSGYTNLEDYLNWAALPHAFVGKNTVAAASSVDIDLTQYAAGFPTGATFTVSGVTGGAATQSGIGGYLVHFVPTVNTSGIGGFSFSVTNGSYTMNTTCGILISASAAKKTLIWKGDNSVNAWDTGTNNWTNQGTGLADAYALGDRVTFNDTGSHSPSVNISAVTSPSSVDVNTDKSNYTFTGYGWLSGTTALVKNGAGTLTIAPTIATTTGTLTSGSPTVTVTSTANLTVGMPVSSAVSSVPSSTTLSVINNATTITLSKNATASVTTTLSFTPYHTYSGPTTFNAGTILLNGGASLGTGVLNLFSTLTNNAGTGTSISLGNSITVAAGTSGTINMGNRMGLNGSTTGSGTLNLNIATTVSRDDISSSFSAFAGTLNFTGSGGVRLFINGGNFDNFGNAKITLASGVFLYPQTNSAGNTITIGELSGGGTLSGGTTASSVNWSVGALNTSTTFSGNIQDNGAFPTSFTKTGSGTLTLTGTLSHTGTTTVSAGTLATLGSFAGPLTVSGGTFSPGTPTTPAGTVTAANSLTLSGGTVVYDLSNSPSGTNDKITVSAGTLTLSSSATAKINFTNGVLGSGVYNLIDGAATMGASNTNPVLSSPQPAGTRQTLAISRGSNAAVNGFLKLTVTGDAANLVWTGGSNGVWDLSTTASNFSGATDNKFYNLDTVIFDDTSALGAITLTGTLQPNVLTVSNSVTPYTFSGSGLIGGNTKLVKNGSGTLTLSNTVANTFTGGTTLNAGTLAIGNSAATLGTGLLTVNGGSLSLISGASLANSILFNASSAITTTGNVTIVSTTTNTFSSSAAVTLDLSGISNILTIGGDMGNFTGTVSLGTSTGMLRLNGNTNGNYGSSNALFDLGTSTATLSNRNGGLTVNLGGLQGGSGTTLQGRQSGSDVTATTYVIGALNTDTVFSGTIATAGDQSGVNITKIGSGMLSLTGTSSFLGDILVQAGTLRIPGSLNNGGGDFEVQSGATLTLSGGTVTATTVAIDSGAMLTGYGTISGDLNNDGTSTTNAATLTVTGTLTNTGTMTFTHGSSLVISGDMVNTGTLSLFGGSHLSGAGSIVNNGIVDMMTGSQTLPANFVNNGIVLDARKVVASSSSLSGNVFTVGVFGFQGHFYQLQRATSLTTASWQNIGSLQTGTGALSGSGALINLTDTAATGTSSFYRVLVTP